MRASIALGLLGSFALGATFSVPAQADTLASGAPADALTLDDEWVTGLSQPTAIAFLPDGRAVITQRTGAVRVRTTAGTLVDAGSFPVNSGPGEQGLLNVVVHPSFATNRLLIFYYSASMSSGGTNEDRHRVVSVELGDDNRLVMSTELVLVQNLRGPANHNGGALAIYQDKLFVGVGDTGANSGQPPSAMRVTNYFATCLTNGNGKVLRVNLDGTVPADNPLVDKAVTACGNSPGNAPAASTSIMGRTEIFAWGFRNPFRIWADPKTGNVWVGDVGEITFEEVNVIPKAGGAHFGWPFREGAEGQPPTSCSEIEPDVGGCVDPVYYCEQSMRRSASQPDDPDVPNDCASITGGVILSDCEWPATFEGRYVFGDYASKQLWTLQANAARTGVTGGRTAFATGDAGPVQFVEHQGALYVVMHAGMGRITRIAPQDPEAACSSAPGGGAGAGGAAVGGRSAGGSAGTPSGGAGGSSAGRAPGGSANAGVPAGGAMAGGSGEGDGEDDSGCGCRVAGGPPSGARLAGVLALGALALLRRRRVSVSA